MKKTPTIFNRDLNNMSMVLPTQHPDCSWVFAGEGVATRKYDGTCCMIQNGKLFKRREVKAGKPFPAFFMVADHDKITGKYTGWVPVDAEAAEDKWHREAFSALKDVKDGTYELVGPSIQGNPEHFENHALIAHSDAEHLDAPRTFDELRAWLSDKDIEGIVWHHPDGRMAKLKLRDFGLARISKND